MLGIWNLSPPRARSYLQRLPLVTRVMIVLIALSWVVGSFWRNLGDWGSLTPSKVSLTSAYRLSTFPLIHLNLIHAVVNVLALTPLIERFENEHGSLTTLALFFGPLTSLPALLYVFIEAKIMRGNKSVIGASIWVFLLLGMEAIRTFRSNPHLVIGTYYIPTWTTPLLMAIAVAALVPHTSLIGHFCGVSIGYVCGIGYLRLLAPPEWALRWIETRLQLLAIVPYYVSIDQKTHGRFGVLPVTNRLGSSIATDILVS